MLESKIESILFFKSEPVAVAELSKLLEVPKESIESAVSNLEKQYEGRGVVVVRNGEEITLGTSPENSELIERVQKDEFSRELGRAGLETLAIILYRGPVSRREVDVVRGVNSSFILRSLMIRGLVEREDGSKGYVYKPTLKLLEHLGVPSKEALPEYGEIAKTLENFVESHSKDDTAQ